MRRKRRQFEFRFVLFFGVAALLAGGFLGYISGVAAQGGQQSHSADELRGGNLGGIAAYNFPSHITVPNGGLCVDNDGGCGVDKNQIKLGAGGLIQFGDTGSIRSNDANHMISFAHTPDRTVFRNLGEFRFFPGSEGVIALKIRSDGKSQFYGRVLADDGITVSGNLKANDNVHDGCETLSGSKVTCPNGKYITEVETDVNCQFVSGYVYCYPTTQAKCCRL